jgi:RNA polymerase sigma factor (sigma-70 family)
VRRIPTRASWVEDVRIGNVCRKLLRMCRGESSEDARDLVQETYLRFLEKRRQVANEEAYLKKMIKNRLPGFWREKHDRTAGLRALEELLGQLGEGSSNNPSVTPAAEELEELLKKAIDRLSPRLRAAIELDTQGLSDEQIAARLGVEPATVKKHLSRARARLKSIMLQEAEHADE